MLACCCPVSAPLPPSLSPSSVPACPPWAQPALASSQMRLPTEQEGWRIKTVLNTRGGRSWDLGQGSGRWHPPPCQLPGHGHAHRLPRLDSSPGWMEMVGPPSASLPPVQIRRGTPADLCSGQGLAPRSAGGRVSSAASLARSAALTLRPAPARHPRAASPFPGAGWRQRLCWLGGGNCPETGHPPGAARPPLQRAPELVLLVPSHPSAPMADPVPAGRAWDQLRCLFPPDTSAGSIARRAALLAPRIPALPASQCSPSRDLP